MAMSITAVIGLTVAGVAIALSTAHAHSQDYYQSIQTNRSAVMQIQRSIRKTKLITATDGSSLVAWAGDTNANGLINLSELLLLSYDQASGELVEYRVVFPDSMDAQTRLALDVESTLATVMDPAAVEAMLTEDQYCQRLVIASAVKDFSVSAWPDVPLSRLVRFQLTVGQGQRDLTLRSAACMRADMIEAVGISDDQYVLDGEGGD